MKRPSIASYRRVLIALSASLLLLLLLGCPPPPPRKVRVGYLDITNSLPLYVAVEKGFFKSQGLEVELSKFPTSNDLVEALLAGRIDAEVSASTSLLYAMELRSPGLLKIFSVNVQTKQKAPDYIIVKRNSPIVTVADLAGKKLGTFPGSTFLVTIRLILAKSLDPAKVTIEQIPPPAQVEALASGKVDAIYTLDPFGILALDKAEGRVLEAAPAEKYIMDSMPAGAAAFSSVFIKVNAAAARKVSAAFDQAIDFIRSNEAQVRQYLPSYTTLSSELAGKVSIVEFWKSKEIQLQPIQHYADILYREGDLKGQVKAVELVLK